VAFSPDGLTLASGSEDGTVKLWDVPKARGLDPKPGGNSGAQPLVLFFALAGATVAVAIGLASWFRRRHQRRATRRSTCA
jgi:hypothetical protein